MAMAGSVTPMKNNAIYNDVDGKIIHDPIHGSMFFHGAIISIIDTPEFQRLRNIKQLGGSYLVFPGAVHTRFDHSLGTAHLCGVLLRAFKGRSQGHIIEDKDILLVQIAGLCHDLGQGPFSRVYKHQYLRALKQENYWKQSTFAVKIFELIIKYDKVKNIFDKYRITDEDTQFIKYAIKGEVPNKPKKDRFLYEIVKNKRNGVDCNMFDTILRDCFFVGIKSSFDYSRYILNASINKVGSEYRICVRDKERFELRELFHTLWTLQHRVYKHKTTVAIERMLAEAFHSAEDVFDLYGACKDPKKLLTLSDDILTRIMFSEDQRLAKAQQILRRIQQRDLLHFCGQTTPKGFIETERKAKVCEDIKLDLITRNDQSGIRDKSETNFQVDQNDIVVDIVEINFGIGYGDPMEKVDFVNKYKKPITFKNQVNPEEQSHPIKRPYENSNRKMETAEGYSDLNHSDVHQTSQTTGTQTARPTKNQYIRVYARDEKKKDAIISRFYSWCNENDYEVSIDLEKIPVEHEEDTPPSHPLQHDLSHPSSSSARRRLFTD
eukprot:gene5457-6139_t